VVFAGLGPGLGFVVGCLLGGRLARTLVSISTS
jgi:hypothetical protein